MTSIGQLIKLDRRLQAVATAAARMRELERVYGRERLEKSKSEAGYEWRALRREFTKTWQGP